MSDVATTPVALPVEMLDVEDGFNTREEIPSAELEELKASITANGIVTALTVRPGEDGRYVVVAGHRRLQAAKEIGLETVPVHVRDGEGRLSASIAENLIRQDLNPIEEAKAIEQLAAQESLRTQKAIAARVGKSTSFVADRLRLLKLPEDVQELVASGRIPTSCEKVIRDLAKVSEPAAVAVARFAVENGRVDELSGNDVVELLYDLLSAPLPEGVILVDASRGFVSPEVLPEEEAEALCDRYATAERRRCRGYTVSGGVRSLPIGSEGIDAARAAGCLLGLGTDWNALALITDRELAVDLVERGVAAVETAADEHEVAEAERAKERGEEPEPSTAGLSPEERAEAEKVARRKEREKAAKAREKAEEKNEKLGLDLRKRHTAATRKAHSLDRAKRIARLVLSQNSGLPGAGLRYVLPALQDVEVTTLKSGAERSKVVHKTAEECCEYLLSKIEESKTPQEVLEWLTDALIAAGWADENALAMSNRIHWYGSGFSAALADLKAEAKEVGAKGNPRSP